VLLRCIYCVHCVLCLLHLVFSLGIHHRQTLTLLRPLELEGEYPERGQRLADPKRAQTTQIPAETRQYEDLPVYNVPGRPPDTDTTSVEPPECDRTPGCVRQLRQDDDVQGLLARCAGLEWECQNTGARPEAHLSETQGLGNRPEVLESEVRGLGSMPKGATYWMHENLLSVDAQRRARLKAESCTKDGSADTSPELEFVTRAWSERMLRAA
jgi:hypothetical protein